MIRLEALGLAVGKMNGAFDDPSSKAFQLCNPGLLRTWRPEKKFEAETNYRIFTSMMGGFKALLADLQAKCSGKNSALQQTDGTLKSMLALFGFKNEAARSVVLYLRRALKDEGISNTTPISWFCEAPREN